MSGLNPNLTPEVMRPPHLPDEIILQILGYLPNIATLYEITRNVNESFLTTSYWECLSPFIARHPLQIQRLIRFVMCVRYGHVSESRSLMKHLYWNLEKQHPPPPATFSKWKQFQLNHTKELPDTLAQQGPVGMVPPFLILDSVHDPAAILKDMSVVCSDLEHLVHSFINNRLRKTHAKFRAALVQEYRERYRHCNGGGHSKAMHEKHWGPNYCLMCDATETPVTDFLPLPAISFEPTPPSPTEVHRIWRAFWRLLLYSDLFHGPNPRYRVLPDKAKDATYGFIEFLTIWELEEMECAYHHLEAQVTEYAHPGNLSYSPGLASRLRTTFGLPKDSSPYNIHITSFLRRYRDPSRSVAATEWPDTQDANKPNAGWQYLLDRNKSYHLCSRTKPLECFLDWGYCIWDQSRLDSWWLLDRKGNKFLAGKAKSEWWCTRKCIWGICGYCDRAKDILKDSGKYGCDPRSGQGRQRPRRLY